ncbi:hypothetical protein [Pusillimonas sp. ANT_WB101]|uniref:hypothetical protein n=1 Tax=Pusillimonas sp. ANT_WB101 TaxID=2597356 RepID=UPI001CAA81FC|nr:hypothetical protein [Pusillimonas sp. ANT_WB101]
MTATRMRQNFGARLLLLGALIGFAVSVFDYFWTGNGIHGTAGLLLVIITSAVMLILGGALAHWRTSSSRTHGILLVLLLIVILGTAFAAYMLEAWWVLGGVTLALIGWLVDIGSDTAPPSVSTSGLTVAAVAMGASLAALLFGYTPDAQSAENPPKPASALHDASSTHGTRPTQDADSTRDASSTRDVSSMHGASSAHDATPTPTPTIKQASFQYHGWYTFNGDLMAQKFSTADQITPKNVAHLQKV